MIAPIMAVSACGATANRDDGEGLGEARIMVPNSPGGGYDTTARVAAKVMEDVGIADNIEVFNLSGAGGTVGLQRTVNEEGNGDLVMQMGLGVVGASYTQDSEAKLTDTTAVARLIEEAGGIVVPADSPYDTMADLVEAWKADPGDFAVGGGSSPGGPDHLLPMQLAETVGIDPAEVNYVSYDGGGELLPAVLGGKVAFAATGIGEFIDQIDAGQLKVLGVSSEETLDILPDVPTLLESDIDLVFTNWRGWVAPPGISDDERQKWIDALEEMYDSQEWQDELEKQGWDDAFLAGDEFTDFLAAEDEKVGTVLEELGLS